MDGLKMKRLLKILILTALISLLLASTAEAQGKAKKLLRGVANTLTGWVEIPKNIYDTSVEENLLAGGTLGTIEGIGMAIVRTGCGVYEVVTFPFPVPEGYQPILYPEYVLSNDMPADVDEVGMEGQKTYKLIGDNEYEEI